MPDINLILKADLNPINTAFGQGEALIDETNNAVKRFEKNTNTAFTSATKEAGKFNDEVKEGSKQINQFEKSTKVIPNATNRLKELRNEIKALTGEAIKLKQQGDITGSNEAIKNAGKLKDELKDIQDAIKSVSGNVKENFTNAIGKATSLAANGFEAATAASALFGEKNEEVEKSLLKLQAIQSLSRLASEFGDIGDRISEIKQGLSPLTNGLKTLYTSGNAGLIALKKNGLDGIKEGFLSLGSSAKSFFVNLGPNIKSFVTSSISGIKSIGAAAAANPFGVILIAITAIIGIMVLLKDKIKPIGVLFDAIGDAISKTVDELERFGELLGIVDDASEKRTKNSIKNYSEELDAIKSRYDFEIKLAQISGKETKKIEEEKFKATESRIKEQIASLYLLNAQEGKATEERIKLSKEARKELVEINKEQTISIAQEKADALKKEKEDSDKAIDKLKAARKDLADFLLNLAKQSSAAEIELLSGEAKINAQHKADEQEIETLKKTFLEKERLAGKANQLTLEQAEQFNNLQLLADKKQADAILAFRAAEAKKLADSQKKEIDSEIAFLDRKTALAISVIEGSQNTTKLSEVEFEKSKQKAILNVQEEALRASLDLKIKQIEANEALTKKDIDRQTDLIIDETEAQVQKIQRELEKLSKGDKKFSLAKLLKISDEELASIEDSLKQAFSAVSSIINQELDQRLEANQKIIDSSKEKQDQLDSEIEGLKSKLDKEKELNDQGLANNTDRINREIQSKIAQQEAEKELEQKAIEQRKKIQKEKLLLDSILQASNLFTAATEIYAKAAAAGGPAGVPIAIVAIATMLASFVLSKAAALKAINEGNGFKEGGYTGGNSVDEERGVVHGKEFVHTADKTKEHRNLFEGIHKDDKLLIHKGILDLLEGTGINIEPSLPGKLSGKKDSLRSLTNNNLSVNNKGLEDRIDILNKQVVVLSNKLDNKTTVLNDGSVIEKFGNVTRKIRK